MVSLLFWCPKNVVIKNGFGTIFPFKSTSDDDGPLYKGLFWKQKRNSHKTLSHVLWCPKNLAITNGFGSICPLKKPLLMAKVPFKKAFLWKHMGNHHKNMVYIILDVRICSSP